MISEHSALDYMRRSRERVVRSMMCRGHAARSTQGGRSRLEAKYQN